MECGRTTNPNKTYYFITNKIKLITLTHENLHSASSSGWDGFTKAQLAELGISWPAKKGWLSALIGKQITAESYARFCAAGKIKIGKIKPASQFWHPAATAPKTRVILADTGYPWPLPCLWDAEAGKWAVAFLNVETKNAAKESQNVWWETEYESVILGWTEMPVLKAKKGVK